MSVVSKTFVPKNVNAEQFSDRVQFVIAVQNKTARDIAGVKGDIEFDDMFGTEIKSIEFSLDQSVRAGQIATLSNYGMDLNQFEDSDNKLAQTDLGKMKVTFHPQMIVFSDGAKLVVPTETAGPS